MDFKEGILADPELGARYWHELLEKAKTHPLFLKPIKEGLYSDVAGALGGVNDIVWKAAQPATISREIMKVIPTKNSLERFPKDIRAYAFEGEGPAFGTGARADTQDVKASIEPKVKKEWSETYLEDASWDVLNWQIESIGQALARFETEKVIAAYNAIANADLAGGAELTITDGAPTWAQITGMIQKVEQEDFHPNVIALNPHEYGGLIQLDQFISALYLEHGNVRPGVIKHTTLDVTFVRSSLITKTLCIDTNAAGALLLRRDVQIKPYEATDRGMFGVYGSERFGLGVLRTKAVARGTN